MKRIVIAAALLASLPAATKGLAQSMEPRSQPPWAYTYRVDEAGGFEFMATTPAAEDPNVWLLISCNAEQEFFISLLNSHDFAGAPCNDFHLVLQFDDAPSIAPPAKIVSQRQITADPAATAYLFAPLSRSRRLSIILGEDREATRTYSFQLQPNDLALHDIDVHCFHNGA